MFIVQKSWILIWQFTLFGFFEKWNYPQICFSLLLHKVQIHITLPIPIVYPQRVNYPNSGTSGLTSSLSKTQRTSPQGGRHFNSGPKKISKIIICRSTKPTIGGNAYPHGRLSLSLAETICYVMTYLELVLQHRGSIYQWSLHGATYQEQQWFHSWCGCVG